MQAVQEATETAEAILWDKVVAQADLHLPVLTDLPLVQVLRQRAVRVHIQVLTVHTILTAVQILVLPVWQQQYRVVVAAAHIEVITVARMVAQVAQVR